MFYVHDMQLQMLGGKKSTIPELNNRMVLVILQNVMNSSKTLSEQVKKMLEQEAAYFQIQWM